MNRATSLLTAIVCGIVFTGCTDSNQGNGVEMSSSAAEQQPEQEPGIHQQTLTLADGTTLRFGISVPGDYDRARPAPLVLALHFGGPVSPFTGTGMLRSLIDPALKDLDAIIVAPDSVGGDWMQPANEEAVEQLLDFVTTKYAIDPARTLVTGFSMGGRGTWHVGSKYPERFTLAIPIAGAPDRNATWTLPVYAIHSDADEIMPLEMTEEYIRELQNEGIDATLAVVHGISHYETKRFGVPLREAVPWIQEHWRSHRKEPVPK